MVTDPDYVKKLSEQVQPKTSNYVKFQSGERKILEFIGDEEHAFKHNDPRFGERTRFIVRDFTDPMHVKEDLIWDTSDRWANMVCGYLMRDKEMLEIVRNGTGTSTNYQILPAISE